MNNKLCVICGNPHNRHVYSTRAAFCWDCNAHANKIAGKAHCAVANAIKRGDLPSAKLCKCVDCGNPATMYEHRDYSKPLDVEPVCWRCNSRRWVGKYPAIAS